MKKTLLLLLCFVSTLNHAQGCVDRVVTGDDMTTLYLLDGTSMTWGKNYFGQLGNGTDVLQSTPMITTNGTKWIDINHGRTHTVALKENNTVWSWGNNYLSQLGNGTNIDSFVPIQTGNNSDWVAISPGNLHTVALKEDGTLWGWGNNGAYELSSNTSTSQYNNPIQLSTDTDWNKIFGGYFKTFAIKNNGTLWGRGRNNYGDLGIGSTIALTTLTQIGTDSDWAKVSAARSRVTLALKTNGTLWAWGDNQFGQIGDGTTINRHSPVQIGTDTWKDIAAGNHHCIGIKSDGTLWQWGSYGITEIGIIIPNSSAPVQIGNGTNWRSVTAGYSSSFAVNEENELYAWGYNGGYLGDGTSTSQALPILISCAVLSSLTFDDSNLTIYPNPVKDFIYLNDITDLKSFEIINMLGQNVASGNLHENKIDLTHLSKGIYVGKFIKYNGQIKQHKFVKE